MRRLRFPKDKWILIKPRKRSANWNCTNTFKNFNSTLRKGTGLQYSDIEKKQPQNL